MKLKRGTTTVTIPTISSNENFLKYIEEVNANPSEFVTVLMFTIQMRQILRTNIDGKAIDGDGEWLFHYFGWPNPSDTTHSVLKMMDSISGFED